MVGWGGGEFLIRAGGMRCKLVFDKPILIFLHISQVLLVKVEVVKLRNKFLNLKKNGIFKNWFLPLAKLAERAGFFFV